jgi:valyl-tRNA synthetase
MPYYSAVVWLYHLQSSLFISFHTSNSNEIYNPMPFANEAYQFQRKLWENHDLSVASNYLYLFMWAALCIVFLLYFKMSFSNMAETELKVTQALEIYP